ncbi:MAG TPA: AAA family ATPase [Thermomicrobiales bacterium]|nr:AAA family ATPase [Thermomicrobiales bacterium]
MPRRASSNASPWSLRSRSPFVGREWELAELHAALDEMVNGHCQIVLIAGEPGIGKTRLIEEFCESASRGIDVCWGRCDEQDGSPAYWPWIQILNQFVSAAGRETVVSWLGGRTALLTQIVPALAGEQLSVPDAPPVDAEHARFQLFTAVADLLRHVASTRPLVLVIDDLHWADISSLALIQFLAGSLRHEPVLLIATYRSFDAGRDAPLSSALAALSREQGHLRLVLRGLSRDDVESFVAESTGTTPARELVDAVFDAVDGNAFFMREVMRLILAETPKSGRRSEIRVPETVRDVVGHRVNRLPAACIDQIEIASVIGREFSPVVLGDIANCSTTRVIDDIEPAVAAGLIEMVDVGRYRFSHALVRDALYEDLPSSRRLSLHRLVGEVLERRPLLEPAAHFAELSRHFGLAASVGSAERAIAYALKVADTALSQYAWETAIEYYRLALRSCDLLDDPDPAQRCRLLLLLGEAQTLAGAGRERAFLEGTAPAAIETFWQAARLAQSMDSPAQLARAALGIAGHSLGIPQAGQEGLDLMATALASLPPEDSPLRAQLLARLTVDVARAWSVGGLCLGHTNTEWIIRRSDEAVAIARRAGDARTLAFALAAKRLAREGSGELDDWLDEAEEILHLASATGDLQIAIWGLNQKHSILVESGQPAAAGHVLDELEQLGERVQTPMFRNQMTLWRSGEALRQGRFDEADALLQQARSVWPRTAMATFQLSTLRREQCRLDEVVDLAGERFARLRRSAEWRAFWVLLNYETGAVDAAQALFDDIAALDFTDLPRGVVWLRSIAWLAESASLLRDERRSELLYDLLTPYVGRNLFAENSDHSGGAIAYYLGLLSATLGRWDDAERHFQDALTKNERWQQWPYAAHTRHAWADMLLRRGNDADKGRALTLNADALEASGLMGMARLSKLARALQNAAMTDNVNSVAGKLHGLSARELDVLRLIVNGRTDREIAGALFISPRTVGSHVGSILAKLGTNSRTEAAARAIREGLV